MTPKERENLLNEMIKDINDKLDAILELLRSRDDKKKNDKRK